MVLWITDMVYHVYIEYEQYAWTFGTEINQNMSLEFQKDLAKLKSKSL